MSSAYTDNSPSFVNMRFLPDNDYYNMYTHLGSVHYHPRNDETPINFSEEDKNVAYYNEIAIHIIDAKKNVKDLYDYVSWLNSDLVLDE